MDTIGLTSGVLNARQLVSYRLGLIKEVLGVARTSGDPFISSMGVIMGDTTCYDPEEGNNESVSSGCGIDQTGAFLSTVGETVERYAPGFHKKQGMVLKSYRELEGRAVPPSEFALFHPKQLEDFKARGYRIREFTEDTPVYWDKCFDLATGKETYCPAAHIYMPWKNDPNPILFGTSTGLSGHSSFYKALLTSLYEVIERDSFVITWHQRIACRKIKLNEKITSYIKTIFPVDYEWNLFDMTYDLKVPTILAFCFGKAEFGDFVIAASATRSTYREAIQKTIQEVAQSVPYYRFLAKKRKDWMPDDDFYKILNFEDHSLFYNKRTDLLHVFDCWRSAPETVDVDFEKEDRRPAKEKIRDIVSIMAAKKYNVLVKDLTTPDLNQVGLYSVRVVIPQLTLMSGGYPFYHLGSPRIYSVPKLLGCTPYDFDHINRYPHPFP